MSDKAYLIGIIPPGQKKWQASESFDELCSLAKTSGVALVGDQLVEVRKITPATYIGKGKLAELADLVQALCPDVVIVDAELSATQNRNIEQALGARVMDRTSLILDIFALHAHSREGKLQVELAQYEYLSSRLVGAWTHLSKQRGGGVGLRGPGETQLEVDRRRMRERMAHLKKDLAKLTKSRELHRRKRAQVPIPTMTLVGYTNAGKSTLFNSLTQSGQFAEDLLFATLDPKTKKIKLPSNREVLVSDTVGFIRNLPHQLVESFKSTFEEAKNSDLLLHIIDTSNSNYRHHMEVVQQVLNEIGLGEIPVIEVMNKTDVSNISLLPNETHRLAISALKQNGIDDLLQKIDTILSRTFKLTHLLIPHSHAEYINQLYTHARIVKHQNQAEGVRIEAYLSEKWQNKLKDYISPSP